MAQCISPILVQNAKRRDFVPCGKCNFCLETKRNDWSFRLNQELKACKTSIFLTLTYEDSHLPYSDDNIPTLQKRHLQLFTKRIRKANAARVGWKLRYYSVGEYGTHFDRPHYHALIFNLSNHVANKVQDFWQYGFIKIGTVEPASIHYVTKYVVTRSEEQQAGRAPPFAVMSRNPGIGANYLKSHTKWHRNGLRNYANVNGVKSRLPRYYKEKMFSKIERENMGKEALLLYDEKFRDELRRIYKTDPDAFNTYVERVRYKHEKISKTIHEKFKKK